jgi:catechol 2,3-dioxygenase-like lactoylglutathione lyase family enzyme
MPIPARVERCRERKQSSAMTGSRSNGGRHGNCPRSYAGTHSHFAPVRVNESLVLDFDTRDTFDVHHYAFKVSEPEFDGIFGRVKGEGLAYGSGPFTPGNMEINHRGGGRGFYFKDPNGHLLEVLTA